MPPKPVALAALVAGGIWMMGQWPLGIQAAVVDRPNVVIMLADDLGWSDVGYHNDEMRTPNIDALVRTGLELDSHYVMPMCTPTRVALMTGRYPSRFGTHCTQATNNRALPPGTPTIASLFQQAGYETALIGKWHLGSKPEWGPNLYGFDYSFGSLAGAVGPYDHRYRLSRPEFTTTFHRNHEFITQEGHITDLTMHEAVSWIEKERSAPFFLYVPFHAVHVPIVEDDKWLQANAHIQRPDRRLFAAAVSHMDHAVGEIVAALDRTSQRDKTLIIFMSDNGGHSHHPGGKYPPPDPALSDFSSNLPLRGEKTEAYEGGIRVPAFIHWPGVLSPSFVASPLHAVDWFPTLAALLTAPKFDKRKLDGQNLWPLFSGDLAQLPPRTLYWVTDERRKWVAVRNGDWKIVKRRGKHWQLFNLATDPHESTDRALREPEVLQRLLRIYEFQWAQDGGTETLFDGKTLQGWTTSDGQPVTRGWRVVDGMIQCQQVQPRPGHIITERPFGNFRLSFEWKISPEGNGGLKYRVRKYDGKWRGCEYQVLDDLAYRKSILPRKSAGALYDLYAPNENKHLRPVGAFNSSEIFVEHNRIQHWLNGRLILSASVGDEDWKQRVAESKFHDLPEFGRNQIGRIMLTDHDSATWYRNFRFQALPMNPK